MITTSIATISLYTVHYSVIDHIIPCVVVQSLSRVLLFVTPWTAACQASLAFTIFQSLLKLISTESVMPSNHLILCPPASPPPLNLSQRQGLFQWVDSLRQVAKVLYSCYSLCYILYPHDLLIL